MTDLFDLKKKAKDAAAIRSDAGRLVTYGELSAVVQQIAGYFDHAGIVLCLCENTPGAAAGYLGALAAGVLPLLLGADLGAEQRTAFLSGYRPNWIWAPLAKREELALDGIHPVFSLWDYGLWKMHEDILRFQEKSGLLLATSGSTGNPKLVRLSRNNLRANAESIMEYLHLDETERPITTLPMQYSYGLSVIHSHLLAGACILMTKYSVVQQEFWDFLEKEQATSFSGVPYTYQILKKLKIFQTAIPSLKQMTQAGGKLPEELQKEIAHWARAQGVKFYVMYGQTEATARMGYLPPDLCEEKTGSIGIAIPGGQFWLIDEKGNRITNPNCVGELMYRGPNVGLGYADCLADLTKGDEWNGTLATGDFAEFDTDGCYYITGRKQRFIKLYGIRINLDACEAYLREQFPWCEIACHGNDEQLLLVVTDPMLTNTAVQALADYLQISPRGIQGRYRKELPKTDSGKIKYGSLCTSETTPLQG